MDWSYPLRAACERNPRRPAVRYRDELLTFAELESRVGALAGGLRRAGMAGETVAWMLANTPEAIEVSMASPASGRSACRSTRAWRWPRSTSSSATAERAR